MLGINRTYVSEYALWMEELRAGHPEWVKAQREGYAQWWDSKPDEEAESGFAAAKVEMRPYPYDVNFYLGR